jgi:hypothetical protein
VEDWGKVARVMRAWRPMSGDPADQDLPAKMTLEK